MYATAPDIQIGTYPDLWKQGRYRIELAAQLPYETADMDGILQQLGYEAIDADQGGRSYRHSQDHNKAIELDELDDPTISLKLLLRYSDLDEAGVGQAEDQLDSLYNRICQMCRSRHDDSDYDSLDLPICPEIDQYDNLGIEQSGNEKLTYGTI